MIQIGSLICYNAAGQRKTSLGLVVGMRTYRPEYRNNPLAPAGWQNEPALQSAVQILWTICPKMPPQVDWDSYGGWSSNLRKEGNLHREPTWYKNVDSIELAKLS